MSDARRRLRGLLEIVRRQHVVRGVTNVSKKRQVRRAMRRRSRASGSETASRPRERRRPADPQGQRRRRQPEQRKGQDGARMTAPRERGGRHDQPERRAARHPPIEAEQIEPRTSLRLRRRRPFEKMTARDEESHHRSRDGVAHSPGLVGQERDRKKRLHGREPHVGGERADVTAKANAGATREHEKQGRKERRDRDRGEDEQDRSRARRRGSSQHRPKLTKVNGASSERRRLSSIFQRPTHGTARRPIPSANTKGRSCQSPRVQRCWRLATTS